jgi:hypothetical protein
VTSREIAVEAEGMLPFVPDESEIHNAKFLDEVGRILRLRHFGLRAEVACVDWTWRFIVFHRKRGRREMGLAEVRFSALFR